MVAVKNYNKKIETLKLNPKAFIFKSANEKLNFNLPDDHFEDIEFVSKDLLSKNEIIIYQKYCLKINFNIKVLIEEFINKFIKVVVKL